MNISITPQELAALFVCLSGRTSERAQGEALVPVAVAASVLPEPPRTPQPPMNLVDSPSAEGLGGPAGWHPPTTAGGAVANAHTNALLGHSGLAAHGVTLPVLAERPSGSGSGEVDLMLHAHVSRDLADRTWTLLGETVNAWLVGWLQTQEVEIEVDEAMLDPDGNYIVEPAKGRIPAQIRRHKVSRSRTIPVEQPDRVELLRRIGTGKYPPAILQMAKQAGGLQALIWRVLAEHTPGVSGDERLQLAEAVAGNMVQISHAVFPDLHYVYEPTGSCAWKQHIPEVT